MIRGIHYFSTELKTKIDVIPRGCVNFVLECESINAYIIGYVVAVYVYFILFFVDFFLTYIIYTIFVVIRNTS